LPFLLLVDHTACHRPNICWWYNFLPNCQAIRLRKKTSRTCTYIKQTADVTSGVVLAALRHMFTNTISVER